MFFTNDSRVLSQSRKVNKREGWGGSGPNKSKDVGKFFEKNKRVGRLLGTQE